MLSVYRLKKPLLFFLIFCVVWCWKMNKFGHSSTLPAKSKCSGQLRKYGFTIGLHSSGHPHHQITTGSPSNYGNRFWFYISVLHNACSIARHPPCAAVYTRYSVCDTDAELVRCKKMLVGQVNYLHQLLSTARYKK